MTGPGQPRTCSHPIDARTLKSTCISAFKQFEAILRTLNIEPFSVSGITYSGVYLDQL